MPVQTLTWKHHRHRQLRLFPFNPRPSRRQFPDGDLPWAQLLWSPAQLGGLSHPAALCGCLGDQKWILLFAFVLINAIILAFHSYQTPRFRCFQIQVNHILLMYLSFQKILKSLFSAPPSLSNNNNPDSLILFGQNYSQPRSLLIDIDAKKEATISMYNKQLKYGESTSNATGKQVDLF